MSPKPSPPERPEENSDRQTGDFLLRLCHDLRACLRSIQPPTELLLRGMPSNDSAATEHHLHFLLDGARNLDSLVSGLANYAIALQIDPVTFTPTGTDAILRRTLMKLEKQFPGLTAAVTYKDLPRVAADPDRLQQLLENLIRNAAQQTADRDRSIEVRAEPDAAGWLFSLVDNGPGLEPRDLDRAFRPFERIHAGPRNGPGLGLATCRAIIERHGGRIWAESDGKSGCTVCFTLPGLDA